MLLVASSKSLVAGMLALFELVLHEALQLMTLQLEVLLNKLWLVHVGLLKGYPGELFVNELHLNIVSTVRLL